MVVNYKNLLLNIQSAKVMGIYVQSEGMATITLTWKYMRWLSRILAKEPASYVLWKQIMGSIDAVQSMISLLLTNLTSQIWLYVKCSVIYSWSSHVNITKHSNITRSHKISTVEFPQMAGTSVTWKNNTGGHQYKTYHKVVNRY